MSFTDFLKLKVKSIIQELRGKMKRILFIFGILFVLSMPTFAQSEEKQIDEQNETEQAELSENNNEQDVENSGEEKTSEDADAEDDVRYVSDDNYKINGRGDQFLKIGIMPNFPLNFGEQLSVGGAAQIGYFRFLNAWLALGGELMAGYNPTLGSNVFTFVPVTFGAMVQPVAGRFEFPTILSAGFAFETCANKKYFPGLVGKAETGAFFRITEGWSVGLSGEFLFLPQWYTDTDNAESDYGMFLQAAVSARYHF